MTWSADPQKNRAFAHGESIKIRWELVPYTQGTGLDIGCGAHKALPHFIGIDRAMAKGPRGPNLCGDAHELPLYADHSMDFVFSSHALEDIEDYQAALAEWWRVLKVGGHLVLYLPHADLYPNVGTPNANRAHRHDFRPADIVAAMRKVAPAWDLLIDEVRDQADEYSFFQVYRKTESGQHVMTVSLPREERCIVFRCGGFGDALVAASTFSHLRAQGYFLEVWTSPKGAEILRHDPNINRLVTHDITGLPLAELRDLWGYWRSRCAKFVNFSESFEQALLANPQRPNFYWPMAARRKWLDGNYLELAHDVADVPHSYRQRFYPTPAESAKASRWRADKSELLVMNVSGSGVNKFWPGIFEFTWKLLQQRPRLHIALVGDFNCAPFLEHERLHAIGSSWPIRGACALALQADMVMGQETGILNAVAMEAMPKIVLLSHSSPNNLTREWVDTWTLRGDVECYPCHRLHATWETCRRDPDTQLAACQSAITPAAALLLANRLLDERLKAAA